MISNSTYKGYQNHGYKYYEKQDRLSDYEEIMFFNEELQIVSEEVWNRANELREARKTNRRGTTVKTNRTGLKLESLCVCAHCGGKLTLQKDYRYEPVQYILQCRKCKELKSKNQKNWSYKKIERLVNENLEQILALEIDRTKLEQYYNSKKNSNISELEQLLELKNKEYKDKEKAISRANKKLEQLLESDIGVDSIKIITGAISKLKVEAEELNLQIEGLEKEIQEQYEINKSNSNKINMLLQVKDLYYKAKADKQKQLLQMLINKIEIEGKDNIKIYLNY